MMRAVEYWSDRLSTAKAEARRISRRKRSMLQLKLDWNSADEVAEPKKPTAERFARVLALLNFEYDLPPDVHAEAEEVLQALNATREESESDIQAEVRGLLRKYQQARPFS